MKFCIASLLLTPFFAAANNVPLTKGMIINSSVVVTSATYNIDADTSFKKPLLIIDGKNIVVDFNNAVLQGSNGTELPNQFHGIAILIKKGSSNIVLKNANIHGYKIAVFGDSVNNLTIDNCNFSYNYRQQLHSNWKREDISDWLSFHHNEQGEWLRYGAGIYLSHCRKAIIKNNIVNNGQCGLLMTSCDSAEIFDNNFSFNSALGIGMYRSSYNHVYHNRLDFNVRGFSFGKYYRGQDSAGILVFEQCSNNIFAYNSVTHSGDGFFLWAGQHTMDTGEGGCNNNIIYGNDFSYAPTNGIEVTFSRNYIRQNTINSCDNGIWGGYSYNTDILENRLLNNNTAIAIEHGQFNNILVNGFVNNNTSIKLWSREKQPADWIYAKKRNTASKEYEIAGNRFQNENIVYDIMGSDSLLFAWNSKNACKQIYKLGERIHTFDTSRENDRVASFKLDNRDTVLKFIPYKAIPLNGFSQGKNNIRITSWGPYNFNYPVLFLDSITKNGNYYFSVLHNGGTWTQTKVAGFTIINSLGNQLIAKADSSVTKRRIELEYKGPAFADIFGKMHEAYKAYSFSYEEFDPLNIWTVNFYKWKRTNNPNNNYKTFINSLPDPDYTTTTKQIDYTWWGSPGNGLPKDSFAVVATTTMDLPAGDYEISITADDLAKLFIDKKKVIDAWNKKFTELDENTNHSIRIHLEGKHNLLLVHAENDGLADLMFYIRPLDKSETLPATKSNLKK